VKIHVSQWENLARLNLRPEKNKPKQVSFSLVHVIFYFFTEQRDVDNFNHDGRITFSL